MLVNYYYFSVIIRTNYQRFPVPVERTSERDAAFHDDHGAAFAGQLHPVAKLARTRAFSSNNVPPGYPRWTILLYYLGTGRVWMATILRMTYRRRTLESMRITRCSTMRYWRILKHCLRDRLPNFPWRQLLSQGEHFVTETVNACRNPY